MDEMAITLDAVSAQGNFGGGSGPVSVALALGAGVNRIVVICIFITPGAGFSEVSFNGIAATPGPTIGNGSEHVAYIYYVLDAQLPPAGTYNLTVDPIDAANGLICCLSLLNVKQTAPEVTATGQNASLVASWSTNITTLTDNAWVVDCSGGRDRTFTPAAGQTERFDFMQGTSIAICVSTKPVAAAGATSLGWTPSSVTPYAHALAAFAFDPNPPSGGGRVVMF